MILAKQGHRTATGLPFTATRVAGIRERADIPPAHNIPPPMTTACPSTKPRASSASAPRPFRRWLHEGLLPAQQTTPHAPWRIKLTDDIRRRFIAEAPAGYVRLADAAAHTGLARQTILNQIRRGDRDAIHVTQGKRRGLRVHLHPQEQGLLAASAPSATR